MSAAPRLDEVIHSTGIPFIIQGSPETDYPVTVIPDNLHVVGPVWLSSAPAREQDAELASWLARRPTVPVNLGSHVDYARETTVAMVHAIRAVLDVRPDLQFLWKYNLRRNGLEDESQARQDAVRRELFEPLEGAMEEERVGVVHWIGPEPSALLETGDVVATVHHGGANCFYEGVGVGVPHIILPAWVNCYDMAMKAEYLSIGVFGAKKSSPYWDAEELTASFLEVLGDEQKTEKFAREARKLAAKFDIPRRDEAASLIADLARI